MEWIAGTLIAGTLLAGPVAAQNWRSYDAYEARAQYVDEAYEARAQAIPPAYQAQARYQLGPRGAYAPALALEGTKIIGQDPDPFIRTQMRQQHDVSDY